MSAIPKIPANVLRELCDTVAATTSELSNSIITKMLKECSISEIGAGNKRDTLYNSLAKKQEDDGVANNIIHFFESYVSPATNIRTPERQRARLNEVNPLLRLIGWNFDERGKLLEVNVAETIDEAHQKADDLQRRLRARGVHDDVLRFCNARLIEENYFHAVLEATKSLADKIREKTGLTTDGTELFEEAFAIRQPKLALNALVTASEQSEQKGLVKLLSGTFSMFRNVTAHTPQITWEINREDAIDCLTLVSFLHRQLDKCIITRL